MIMVEFSHIYQTIKQNGSALPTETDNNQNVYSTFHIICKVWDD